MRQSVVALVVLSVAAAPHAARPSARAQEKMTTYQLVMLKKGPAAATASTPAGQALLKEHISHLYGLAADGRGMAAGPFTDGGEIQGVLIVKAETPEKALEIEGADPAVKGGIFSMEALPFLSPEGWFGKWEAVGAFETVYFGFLKRGPNRGQDAETARQLQKEHLAYMDGQSNQGKLIVAGPFMVDGDRRGVVVYRVATMEEARQRAEADPMVKAGRLAVELHPWQVPRGALPTLPK
jgi:uncharacterized protein YciI